MAPASPAKPRPGSLTRRLVLALGIGALFVALLLGFLGADRLDRAQAEREAQAERDLAVQLAERAAPLLERADLMRLSVLTTVARDQTQGRILVLERSGRVVIDTALVLGDRQLGLLAPGAPFQRATARDDGIAQRETLAPIRFGGELIGELRLQRDVVARATAFDATWFALVLLGCLSLAVPAVLLAQHWSSRVRATSDAMLRVAHGEVAGLAEGPAAAELDDLNAALHELERGVHDGLQRVGEGYVAMALQLVDSLERRRLVPPGHGERTARLALRLADRVQMVAADRQDLELACLLVDLGKAWVRPAILQKQAPLQELELQSLQQHPLRAAEQLDCVPGLRRVAKIVRHQLERYDGGGGPAGLRGDRIPLGSRVLAIAASFDLLTSCASEKPLSWQDALQQIRRARGDVFDPWLVDLFAAELEKEPPAPPSDRQVLIVPGGAMPWRAMAAATAASDDDEDDETSGEADLEVEVVPDERQRGDTP